MKYSDNMKIKRMTTSEMVSDMRKRPLELVTAARNRFAPSMSMIEFIRDLYRQFLTDKEGDK
jgi:hypothetical protein